MGAREMGAASTMENLNANGADVKALALGPDGQSVNTSHAERTPNVAAAQHGIVAFKFPLVCRECGNAKSKTFGDASAISLIEQLHHCGVG